MNGEEICKYHTELFAKIEVVDTKVTNLDNRINGALGIVAKHIEEGSRYRLAIFGIAITLIVNIFLAIYWYGRLAQKVDTCAYAIEQLETLHPRVK